MKRSIFALGLLTLAAAANLSAGTLEFSNRANWAAQVNILSNFSGTVTTPGGFVNYNDLTGLVLTDLQMTITSINLQQVNASGSQTYYDWGSGAILRSGSKTDSDTGKILVTFSSPVNAFGFNFGGSGTDASHITITPNGYTSVDVNTLARPTWNFFGIVSDTQTFSSVEISITDPNRYVMLDDIARADYSPGPPAEPPPSEIAEPGTLLQLLMGSGLLVLGRQRFLGKSE